MCDKIDLNFILDTWNLWWPDIALKTQNTHKHPQVTTAIPLPPLEERLLLRTQIEKTPYPQKSGLEKGIILAHSEISAKGHLVYINIWMEVVSIVKMHDVPKGYHLYFC